MQGIAEFLPISSSAHLIVISWFTNGEPMPLQLNVALHVGTLLAVLLYFWRDWLRLGTGSLALLRGRRDDDAARMIPALIVGSIPAGIVGLAFQDKIETIFHNPSMTILPLAGFGIAIWAGDKYLNDNRSINQISWPQALFIGCAQALALIPGISRSGSTILGARCLGVNRQDAAKFSFLLGTPIMLAATAKNASDILSSIFLPEFYVGMSVSMIVGCISIKFLLTYLKKYGFGAFAIYRIALAIGILALLRSQ